MNMITYYTYMYTHIFYKIYVCIHIYTRRSKFPLTNICLYIHIYTYILYHVCTSLSIYLYLTHSPLSVEFLAGLEPPPPPPVAS